MTSFILARKSGEVSLSRPGWQRVPCPNNLQLYLKGDNHTSHNLDSETQCIIIGDCINQEMISGYSWNDLEDLLARLKGNFYLILLQKDKVLLANSLFGLLPIYYTEDQVFFSSSLKDMSLFLDGSYLKEDPKYILNQLLFNYQFGSTTPFLQIKLLPSFSYFRIQEDKVVTKSYLRVENLLTEEPARRQNKLSELAECFIEESSKYIPDQGGVISFTGGFDGRTLVSVGLAADKRFSIFSFGRAENDDVYLPRQHAEQLGLPYQWLDLGDEHYTQSSYPKSAKAFLEQSNFQNGLLYAHMDFSASFLAEQTNCLVTGMCGSELLRSTHSAGAVYSQALLDLIRLDSFDEYRQSLLASTGLQYLITDKYASALEEVVTETWNWKLSLPAGLSHNQQLYLFTCEEVFRKFFGAWVCSQQAYLNVRTPYLDFDFFQALQQVDISGAYSHFLTKNPFKRFKGQLLYAETIRKTSKEIFSLKTGKGYTPADLILTHRKPRLFLPYISKRLKRRVIREDLDNLGIISGASRIMENILPGIPADLVNVELLSKNMNGVQPTMNERERDIILQMLAYGQMNRLLWS